MTIPPTDCTIGIAEEFVDAATTAVGSTVRRAVSTVATARDYSVESVSIPDYDGAWLVNDAQTLMEFADVLSLDGRLVGAGAWSGDPWPDAFEVSSNTDYPRTITFAARSISDGDSSIVTVDPSTHERGRLGTGFTARSIARSRASTCWPRRLPRWSRPRSARFPGPSMFARRSAIRLRSTTPASRRSAFPVAVRAVSLSVFN